ncbi:MAG: hypothetical protein DMF89_23935 [Acidobacteria bacterium]|nr:MAG: hypothetical protein DMF90_18285 [Acidobacteriota bacterium]PYR45859.1 MAG: hypothetical protein DMF89_23935 [Acidobacteriota bacterium]
MSGHAGLRTARRAESGRRHDGPHPSRRQGCGSPEAVLDFDHGRHAREERTARADQVPRRLHHASARRAVGPAGREHRQPLRFHRERHAEGAREVEGRQPQDRTDRKPQRGLCRRARRHPSRGVRRAGPADGRQHEPHPLLSHRRVGHQAVVVKAFGANPGRRPCVGCISKPRMIEADDMPGVNLSFSPTTTPPLPTKGRSLDHIGFEVSSLEAFVASLEAKGIKIEGPIRQVPNTKLKIAFLTDPFGTYIELTEGLSPE